MPSAKEMNVLFGNDRNVLRFEYPHIVDKSSVDFSIIESMGNIPFNFTFENRLKMLEPLSEAILRISSVTPEGIVVFLQSYNYLDSLLSHLKVSGWWRKIEALKKIFCESKNSNTFLEYSNYMNLQGHSGAIIFCVIGGKLSEGINFSDHLGRLVLVCGIPYPSSDNEFIVKQTFMEQ